MDSNSLGGRKDFSSQRQQATQLFLSWAQKAFEKIKTDTDSDQLRSNPLLMWFLTFCVSIFTMVEKKQYEKLSQVLKAILEKLNSLDQESTASLASFRAVFQNLELYFGNLIHDNRNTDNESYISSIITTLRQIDSAFNASTTPEFSVTLQLVEDTTNDQEDLDTSSDDDTEVESSVGQTAIVVQVDPIGESITTNAGGETSDESNLETEADIDENSMETIEEFYEGGAPREQDPLDYHLERARLLMREFNRELLMFEVASFVDRMSMVYSNLDQGILITQSRFDLSEEGGEDLLRYLNQYLNLLKKLTTKLNQLVLYVTDSNVLALLNNLLLNSESLLTRVIEFISYVGRYIDTDIVTVSSTFNSLFGQSGATMMALASILGMSRQAAQSMLDQ